MIQRRSHKAEVQRYIDGVLSGEIVAGKLVRAAIQRHVEDLETGPDRGLWFDEQAANDAIDFFPCIRHTTGEYAEEPFELRLFQMFIVWCLFGWKREDGFRRFRYAFISLARGNGKSPFAAALSLLLFAADTPIEPRAQVYSFATKEKQARIVWEEAYEQVGTSEGLKRLIVRLKNNMHIPSNGSKFEPAGSDSKKSDGWIIHGAVIDELHAWSEHHRGLHEKIETAMGKRRQPLCLTITTAGDDQSEIWHEQYEFNVQVVTRDNGIESDQHFVYIAEVDRDQPCEACGGDGADQCETCKGRGVVDVDIFDERNWAMANPMLLEPKSPVKISELRSFANKARILPSAANPFRRYHLNQLVASFYRLIPPELWASGNSRLSDLEGRPCHGGFDWGWRNDLAGLALMFPFEEESRYELKCWAWVPSESPHDLTREPWATWIDRGWLAVTDGNTTDVDAIYKTMGEIVRTYEVRSLAYDPNNAREFSTKCVNEWGIETYDFFQSCRRYNEPTRGFVDALRKGKLRHGGNPLLSWCAGNLTVREDSNEYIMPSKAKSSGKIDPIVAAIMAFSEAKFAETNDAQITSSPLYY